MWSIACSLVLCLGAVRAHAQIAPQVSDDPDAKGAASGTADTKPAAETTRPPSGGTPPSLGTALTQTEVFWMQSWGRPYQNGSSVMIAETLFGERGAMIPVRLYEGDSVAAMGSMELVATTLIPEVAPVEQRAPGVRRERHSCVGRFTGPLGQTRVIRFTASLIDYGATKDYLIFFVQAFDNQQEALEHWSRAASASGRASEQLCVRCDAARADSYLVEEEHWQGVIAECRNRIAENCFQNCPGDQCSPGCNIQYVAYLACIRAAASGWEFAISQVERRYEECRCTECQIFCPTSHLYLTIHFTVEDACGVLGDRTVRFTVTDCEGYNQTYQVPIYVHGSDPTGIAGLYLPCRGAHYQLQLPFACRLATTTSNPPLSGRLPEGDGDMWFTISCGNAANPGLTPCQENPFIRPRPRQVSDFCEECVRTYQNFFDGETTRRYISEVSCRQISCSLIPGYAAVGEFNFDPSTWSGYSPTLDWGPAITTECEVFARPAASAEYPTADSVLFYGASAADTRGITGMWIYLDDVLIETEDVFSAPPVSAFSQRYLDCSTLPEGMHTLTIVAGSNPAHKVYSAAPIVFRVDHSANGSPCGGDSTPPAVTIVAPTGGATIDSGAYTLQANATDAAGVQRVEFYVDDQLIGSDTTAPFSLTWNAPVGQHLVKMKAVDACSNSGWSASRPVSVRVGCSSDHVVDAITMTAPVEGAIVAGNGCAVQLAASAADAAGIASVEFRVRRPDQAVAELVMVDDSAPYECAYNPSVAGVYEFTSTARDACGNPRGSSPVHITVQSAGWPCQCDNQPPSVQVASGGLLPVGGGILHAAASDNVHVQAVAFEIDGVIPSGATILNPPYAYPFVATSSAHMVRVLAIDVCGNIAWSQPVNINRANTLPIAANDSATTRRGVAVDIAVTANDTDPDGDRVRVAVNSPILESPAHGTVVRLNDTTLRYTPTVGYTGSDTFRYRIADGFGGLSSAVVTVNVTP